LETLEVIVVSRVDVSAVHDFREARRRADLERVLARLRGKSADLLCFEDVRQQLRVGHTKPEVLKEIPLDAIVGSVDRCSDFTRSFLPRQDRAEQRWARVDMQMSDYFSAGFPPIDVYQIDQVYFVLDGHHRVSVARHLGLAQIQAYVTEIRTRVPLSPDDEPDDLIVKAEYADFLDRTHLDELRPESDLSVSVPGQYRAIDEHIEVHRYFMGVEQKREIPYEDAVIHWYDEVYLPVVQVIREQGILGHFPERTETDLYLWLSEHRAAVEEELGWQVDLAAAAADMATQFSLNSQSILGRARAKILDAIRPGGLGTGLLPGQWRRARSVRDDRLFNDILIAVSGEEQGWYALEQALEVAQREGANLRGLHVISTETQRESDQTQAVQIEFNRRCEAAAIPGTLSIEVGEVASKICERATWTDLVIVNLAHPPAPRPLARLGSGFRTLIRRCPRPVLAVPGASASTDRALVAYDGSPKAKEALFVATYLAHHWNIPLVVVTVIETGRTTTETQARAQEYLEKHDVRATYVKESGTVAEAILRTAEVHESNLLIMGGYGFSPLLEIVMGSAVDQMLRESRKPVLICR
jgi:nucleotide-binding universal stress UspA family protein